VDRLDMIRGFYPSAVGIDDFMCRVEIALSAYGFTSDNSIAMTNLCRDEVTVVLKDKIESVFGASFNTNGLGAVLTCGATGIGAGLSHSPQCPDGRERYVFFSFPHIAIDATGAVGALYRPGRPGVSCACGAMAKCLGELKAEGVTPETCKVPGVHSPLDPEYTILKQRLARRIRHEGIDVQSMTLCDITSVAERTITDDLEYLIERAVDTTKADYAVVTGIEIHNWGIDFSPNSPSFEFIVPTKMTVCTNGRKQYLDLQAIPPLPARQVQMFAERSMASAKLPAGTSVRTGYTHISTMVEIPAEYLAARLGPDSSLNRKAAVDTSGAKPAWMTRLEAKKTSPYESKGAPTMDSAEPGMQPVRTEYTKKGMIVYFEDPAKMTKA
jgi:hypothetical protein